MKKFIFTPKAKKITIIVGIAVVCAGVLSFSLLQNANAKSENLPSSSSKTSTSVSADVSISPITSDDKVASGTAGTGSSFVPANGKTQSAPLTQASKPSAPPKPVIQGDSQNGKQPTNPALTDKTKKPSYTTPPKAPTNRTSGGNTAKKKSGGSTTGKKTSGGSDPIFGNNVVVEQGGNHQTIASGDGDINKQVGIMD